MNDDLDIELLKKTALKCEQDFEFYARTCLKIVDKEGNLSPFILNNEQKKLHENFERQLKEKGKVRAIVLKGRQQGCCHSPETKVLTSLYEWKRIDSVRPGEKLLAFDEESISVNKRGFSNSRRFRTTIVQAVVRLKSPRVKLTLENGAVLITTPNHKYLSLNHGGTSTQWRKVSSTYIGDVLRVITPPPQEQTGEMCWLAGIFDGEGSIRRTGTVRLSFCQRQGEILERGRAVLNSLGIDPGEVIDARPSGISSKLGNDAVHRLDVHRQSDVLHVLAHCPTTRFREEGLFDDHELPGKRAGGFKSWAKVVKIEKLPEGDVIDLQTEHKTYIAEGIASHNSTYIEARFYWKLWKTKKGKSLRTYILTHRDEATDNLFNMAKRYHEHMPEHLRPPLSRSNTKELIFADTGCNYSVATAGGVEIGRSLTLHYVHASEVGLWPNAEMHVTSLLNTALSGAPGTESIIESTANGIGNVYHRYWQDAAKGKSEYEAIFLPWYWHEEYKMDVPDDWEPSHEFMEYGQLYELTWEQLYWAFIKNREAATAAGLPHDKFTPKFKQEYPACIESTQRVGTDRGYIPISEVKFGDRVSTGVVSRIYNNGFKETVRVKTKLGYSVICTEDHLLQLFDGEWLSAGKCLGKLINLQKPIFAEKLYKVIWKPFPSVKSEILITPEFGRFLGFFMGDGCWHDNTLSIACDAKDKDVVENVRQLLTNIIGEPGERLSGTKKGCNELRITRKDFQEILYALDIIDMKTMPHRRVKVPDCIWRSPKNVVREFLRGLFEADGFADWGAARVSLFSKHREFLADVQKLVLGFDVTCVLKSENKTNTAGYTYIGNVLNFRSTEARAFVKNIGFVGNRKQTNIDKYKPLGKKGQFAMPMIFSDEVVEIEAIGERKVYDLTIPGAHCFDASGIMVHNCADEAFITSGESFIPAMAVLKARKPDRPIQGTGPIIIGVDPARTGDLVGIIDRCGRRMGERICERWEPGGNLVHLSERIAHVLDKIRPDAVCIDVGGNGAAVYDNLLEWGYANIIHAVNFGSKPIGRGPTGEEMYFNRRAEMYDNLRDWFNTEGGVQIPDDDSLQTDLTAIKVGPGATRYNNNNELIIEDKEKIKQRLGSSPDLGDACALTFSIQFYHRAEANWQPPPPRRKTNRRTGY